MKKMNAAITHERLSSLLSYNPETGEFVWKVERANATGRGKRVIGSIVGTPSAEGYLVVMIDSVRYKLHRLAWFYFYKTWPKWIDHRNGIRADNRIDNLREANGKFNAANSSGWSGRLKGVYPQKKSSENPWYAAIRVDRKLIYLGSFPTQELAHAAYVAAAQEHFGEFANGGRKRHH